MANRIFMVHLRTRTRCQRAGTFAVGGVIREGAWVGRMDKARHTEYTTYQHTARTLSIRRILTADSFGQRRAR